MIPIYLANTFVEWELENNPSLSFEQAFMRRHPIFLQLQFLPLLYAPQDAIVLTGAMPIEAQYIHRCHPLSSPLPVSACLDVWGASQLVQQWAKQRQLHCPFPAWSVMRQVNSKAFSFTHSPPLPGAQLIHNETQAKQWMRDLQGPGVLKTCFGVSGQGHYLFQTSLAHLPPFLHVEWAQGRPLIAEPWVPRILDFSTQWMISDTLNYLGATVCKNDTHGQYRASLAGDPTRLFGDYLPFVFQQQEIVRPLLTQIAAAGYFGHVGIDAMIYTDKTGHPALHPIVEINARKTMGWVALSLQQHSSYELIEMSYCQATAGLLPQAVLLPNGKTIRFSRNINIHTNNLTNRAKF